MSSCYFNLHFSITNKIEHICMFTTIQIFPFVNCLVIPFSYFLSDICFSLWFLWILDSASTYVVHMYSPFENPFTPFFRCHLRNEVIHFKSKSSRFFFYGYYFCLLKEILDSTSSPLSHWSTSVFCAGYYAVFVIVVCNMASSPGSCCLLLCSCWPEFCYCVTLLVLYEFWNGFL